jgi:hypothetical protein
MAPNGETHSQIYNIMIDEALNVHDVRSFRAEDCGTEYCLLVEEVRERLERLAANIRVVNIIVISLVVGCLVDMVAVVGAMLGDVLILVYYFMCR